MLILKNHIFRLRTIVAAMLLIAALAVISDSAPQQRDAMTQLKLSQLMPRGALLYAQSRDLGAQLKLWRASASHDRYFASKSYAKFEQSRLFLKLQSRLAEFQTALGFEFTEDTVSALAGGQTALGIYDLGKLEMVFISEMPRTRAFATVLYANAKNFDERNTESGSSYYVREFAADGGRAQQRIAFAYLDGKLFLATSEGLIQRALANSTSQKAGDHLSEDVAATVTKANGFAAHDLTLWLDQAKLNANRYFDNYWLHQNPAQLASLKTGLIDLEMAASAFTEHRWFTIDATAQPAAKGKQAAKSTVAAGTIPRTGTVVKAEQLTDLLRFAPPGVQFMEARAAEPNDERLAGDISQIIFGQLPAEQARAKEVSTALASVDTDSSDSAEPGAASGGQYRQLDARFDRDIDDEAAVKLANLARERDDAAKRFSATLWPIIQAGKPSAFVLLETPQLAANQLFVHFNRAIVVELGDVTALSQPRLEAAIAGELQARFVVGNVGQQIRWQTAGGIHSLQQALLEQGGAYAVSGRTLIIASNKEYCAAVLAEGATTTSYQASLKPNLLRYAVARAGTAAPVFSKLTKVLETRVSAGSSSDKNNAASEGDSESTGDSAAGGDKQEADAADSGPVSFMSQNLVSLLGVIDGMGEATFESSLTGDVLQEVVIYHLTA